MNRNHKMIRKVSVIAAGTMLTGALVLNTGVFASHAAGMPWSNAGNQMSQNVVLSDTPGEIVTGVTSNSAQSLTADESTAVTYVMSDSNSSVKIDSAGTYIITGNCSDGNITVKKNTTGVVLILRDLDLTSTTGATLSCNKYSEVQIIVEGTVSLTDAENPDDEDSADADVADAFDGAAIKIKDGSNVLLTGTGVLNINASACKNGIKVGNDDSPSLVVDGGLTVNISAANDAINSGYDLAVLSGTLTISAGDDGIHADRILTVGDGTNGPTINITQSYEGLEGTVVNLFGGQVALIASDDGINVANSDGTYADLGYSINITAGTHTVQAGGDGLDSNGNINIIGGYTTINSASAGGEAGIDYDGECYIADGTVNNNSGISGPDVMSGQMDQPGQSGQPGQPGQGMGQPGMTQPEGRDANADVNSQSSENGSADSSLNAADYAAVFDADFYYNTYEDLRINIGNDPDALLAHFVAGGMAEGRQGNAEFHVQVYQSKYEDLAAAFGDNLQAYYEHYMQTGKAEGRTANPTIYSRVYDYDYYLAMNPDVAAVFSGNEVAAFNHFLNAGMTERRVASAEFNVAVYMENNPDVVAAYNGDPKLCYLHYMNGGYTEGRIAN